MPVKVEIASADPRRGEKAPDLAPRGDSTVPREMAQLVLLLAEKFRGHGQLGATLPATARKYLAAVLARHARTKSVLVAALAPAGLVRAFHRGSGSRWRLFRREKRAPKLDLEQAIVNRFSHRCARMGPLHAARR
jgi:hypothetical protein